MHSMLGDHASKLAIPVVLRQTIQHLESIAEADRGDSRSCRGQKTIIETPTPSQPLPAHAEGETGYENYRIPDPRTKGFAVLGLRNPKTALAQFFKRAHRAKVESATRRVGDRVIDQAVGGACVLENQISGDFVAHGGIEQHRRSFTVALQAQGPALDRTRPRPRLLRLQGVAAFPHHLAQTVLFVRHAFSMAARGSDHDLCARGIGIRRGPATHQAKSIASRGAATLAESARLELRPY